MKSLEKATADYEKAKEKMEASKARYEADLKRFKAAEIAKTEAERNEVISKSLNKDVLALKQMEVMKDLVNSSNKVIVVPMDFKGMVNVPAN